MGRLRLVACALALFIGGCTLPSHEAAVVARDLAAGEAPSELKEQTPAPSRRAVRFEVKNRRYAADLYTPGDKTEAALLLLPGAAEAGKDDPRLVAFARTLARARFRVLVPDLPSLRRLQIQPENIRQVGGAFRYLISGRDFPAQEQAGIGAFSYAVGPAVIAALQPPLASQVDFILGIGGYYDLHEVLTFATTGYYRADGQWRRAEPNVYGKWVFVLGNLHHLSAAGDRRALRRLAKWHLSGSNASRPQVTLGAEGRAVYRLVTNEERARVPQLLERVPAGIRQVIEALDVSNKDLGRLEARLLLVHGRNDPIIPYTQSLALAEAVGSPQADVFVIQGLVHVDASPGFIGQWRLWRAVDMLLAQRWP